MRKILAIILSMAVILSMTIASMPAAMASGTITGDTYEVPIVSGLPSSASGWSSNSFTENGASISFTNDTNTAFSYSECKAEISLAPTDSASSMFRLNFGKTAAPQSGIYTYSITGYMDGAVPNKINLGTKVDGEWNLATASYESGFAKYVYEHTNGNAAGTPFTISFVVDTYNYTMTSYFNDTKCVVRDAFTGTDGTSYVGSGAFSKSNYKSANKEGKVTTIYFEPVKSKATATTKLILTDAKITVEKKTPSISSVSYVRDGAEIAESDWVGGLFDEKADEIKVYLTNAVSVDTATTASITKAGGSAQVLAHSLSADGKVLTLTMPDEALANGDYTLSIANLLADGMVIANPLTDTFKVDEETVINADTYFVPVVDTFPAASSWEVSSSGDLNAVAYAENNVMLQVYGPSGAATVTPGANGLKITNISNWYRVYLKYSAAAQSGVVTYEMKGKFKGNNPSGLYYYVDNIVGDDTYTYSPGNNPGWHGFENYITDVSESEEKEYTIKLVIDTNAGKMTGYVNDVLCNSDKISRTFAGGKDAGVNLVYFDFRGTGYEFTLTDVNISMSKSTPQFSHLGYILGNEEKVLENSAKVPAVAKSIVLNYTGEVGSDIKTSVKLLKDGAEVSATYKTDGSKVIVTPADGFGNGNYTVSVSGLLVSGGRLGENFNVSKSFEAESVFAITSPEADVLKNASSVKLGVTVPEGYTYLNLLFFVDGKEMPQVDITEDCTLTSSASDLAYGDHVFTAQLFADENCEGKPLEEISKRFELAQDNSSEVIVTPTLSTNITVCEGSDGSADGGVKVAGTNAGQGVLTSPNNKSVLYVEADYKRSEGQGLKLESANDTKADTAADTKFLFLGNIGAGSENLVGTDGSVAGISSIKIPANEWHNIKVVYDTKTFYTDIYIDGKWVAGGVNPAGEAVISRVQWLTIVGSSSSPKPMYLDNIKYGVYDVIPSVEEVSYTTVASSDTVKADGKKISVLANTITLRLSRAFDTLTANSVTVNGVAPSAVSVSSADSKVVTITPATALSEGDVNITFQSGLMLGGTPTDKAVQVLLETEGYLTDSVGDITVSADKKSASVKIIKAVSGSVLPESVDFIIAAYSGERLMKINVENKPLSAENGENDLTVSLPADFSVEGLTVKAFIWNMSTLAPIK